MKKIIFNSASALVTNNGFCVKVETDGEPICFFIDKDGNHSPWKLTRKKAMILDKREFWRMRREWKLEEISIPSADLLSKIVVLADEINTDPYLGLTPAERKRLFLPSHDQMVQKSRNSGNQKGLSVAVKIVNAKVEKSTFADIPGLMTLKDKLTA